MSTNYFVSHRIDCRWVRVMWASTYVKAKSLCVWSLFHEILVSRKWYSFIVFLFFFQNSKNDVLWNWKKKFEKVFLITVILLFTVQYNIYCMKWFILVPRVLYKIEFSISITFFWARLLRIFSEARIEFRRKRFFFKCWLYLTSSPIRI